MGGWEGIVSASSVVAEPGPKERAVRITVLGVPDSAGAYCVRVERAPAALRAAGLVSALTEAGNDVRDLGDLSFRRWTPDRERPYTQNLDDEVDALRELAAAASAALPDRERLLVLGGTCTVAIGLCAALVQVGEIPRIVYVDRHLDLNTPRSTTDGSLSWMGMAHALNLEGCAVEIASVGGPVPLLEPPDLAYLGVDTDVATEWERAQVAALSLTVVPQSELVDDPRRAAEDARAALRPGPFFIHLDVDVLDFIDAPIAENVEGRNTGPSLAQIGPALSRLWHEPDCWGMSIGQVHPEHASSDPSALPRFVDVLRYMASSSYSFAACALDRQASLRLGHREERLIDKAANARHTVFNRAIGGCHE